VFSYSNSHLRIQIYKEFEKIFGTEKAKKLILLKKKSLIKDVKVLFIHIPKAAGTSITDVLYGQRIGHFTLNEYYHFFEDEFMDLKFKFTVARNPLDRLYSAWKFARAGGTNDGGVYNYKIYQKPPFATFDSFVMNWLQFQNLDTCEVLFRTQCHFIETYGNESLKLDGFFHVERLQELEIKLTQVLNKPIVFSKKNTMGGTLDISKIEPYTLSKVCELYACDYETFGYEYPTITLNET
jgi:hypothetical protein